MISMYHTTRLSDVPASTHILSKPSVVQAFARAAIAAMPPAPQWRTIDSVPEGHVVLVCDTKNNRWTDMVSDGDGTDTCGFPLAYWIPLPTPPAGAV